MKKTILIIIILSAFVCSAGFAQSEAWATHTRGLLHQSVFNTGALGVQWESFALSNTGDSLRTPLEWPGNSYFRYNNKDNWYYNSEGGGLMMLVDTGTFTSHSNYQFLDPVTAKVGVDMVGALVNAQASYGSRDGTGTHYWPGTVTRTTNFPLNSDGTWNSSYDPTEAEEKIVSSVSTPYGITITRTSRAWSYPGYDSFIIYDYEFKNTGFHFKFGSGISPTHATDTLYDVCVSWIENLIPSYVYNNAVVGNFYSAASLQLSRFDLTRYMQYVHSPDGRPTTTGNYASWSANGTYGGGLTAPAAVGYMLLYYDYNHLMPGSQSNFGQSLQTGFSEQLYAYDANRKFKQPWVIATTQTNLYNQKAVSHVRGQGKTYADWNPRNVNGDSLALNTHLGAARAAYWYGRARPNNNYNYASPMVHSYALGPYKLAPDDAFHVVFAELAGFGPGRKSDSKYYDFGGGNEGITTQDLFHPVPSWDSVITSYTLNAGAVANATNYLPSSISSTGGVGAAYTPTYGLPTYIRDTTVVSIRDVADRCIQLYNGNPSVIKYDTTQYEPNAIGSSYGTPADPTLIASRSGGWNKAIKLPLPNPTLTGLVTNTIISEIKWKGTVDSLDDIIRPYVNSGVAYYEVLRATSHLGPWTRLDSVGRKDPRYWVSSDALYEFVDLKARVGATYFYCVVPVDSVGKRGGLTNILQVNANLPYYQALGKVYAVPNPFFLVSGIPGETRGTTYIQFFGMTKNATVRIFSFSGQLLKTLTTDGVTQSIKWDLRTESAKKIASGVYYFTVQDNDTGSKTWNKFVVIH